MTATRKSSKSKIGQTSGLPSCTKKYTQCMLLPLLPSSSSSSSSSSLFMVSHRCMIVCIVCLFVCLCCICIYGCMYLYIDLFVRAVAAALPLPETSSWSAVRAHCSIITIILLVLIMLLLLLPLLLTIITITIITIISGAGALLDDRELDRRYRGTVALLNAHAASKGLVNAL